MARRKHRFLTPQGEFRFLTPDEIAIATPHELILSFIPLSDSMARRVRPGCEDTKQDAKLGLVRAAERYDSTKGAFVPYAGLYIKQAINRGGGARSYLIHLPEVVRGRLAAMTNMANALGDDATPSDIAKALGPQWSTEEVEKLLALPQASLQSDSEDGLRLEDLAVDASSRDFDAEEARSDLLALAGHLPRDLSAELHEWLEAPDSDRRMRQVASVALEHLTGGLLL